MSARTLRTAAAATLSLAVAAVLGAPDARTVTRHAAPPSSAAASGIDRATRPSPAAASAIDRAARRALALVARPPDVGYALRFAPARAGVRAQTDRGARVITVFVRPGDAPHRIAHDITHELGHAWDDRHGTAAGRAAYLELRGRPDVRWWPGASVSDYATGAGDFAEVFSRCHAASPEFRSRLGPPPRDACAALRAAGFRGRA